MKDLLARFTFPRMKKSICMIVCAVLTISSLTACTGGDFARRSDGTCVLACGDNAG